MSWVPLPSASIRDLITDSTHMEDRHQDVRWTSQSMMAIRRTMLGYLCLIRNLLSKAARLSEMAKSTNLQHNPSSYAHVVVQAKPHRFIRRGMVSLPWMHIHGQNNICFTAIAIHTGGRTMANPLSMFPLTTCSASSTTHPADSLAASALYLHTNLRRYKDKVEHSLCQ